VEIDNKATEEQGLELAYRLIPFLRKFTYKKFSPRSMTLHWTLDVSKMSRQFIISIMKKLAELHNIEDLNYRPSKRMLNCFLRDEHGRGITNNFVTPHSIEHTVATEPNIPTLITEELALNSDDMVKKSKSLVNLKKAAKDGVLEEIYSILPELRKFSMFRYFGSEANPYTDFKLNVEGWSRTAIIGVMKLIRHSGFVGKLRAAGSGELISSWYNDESLNIALANPNIYPLSISVRIYDISIRPTQAGSLVNLKKVSTADGKWELNYILSVVPELSKFNISAPIQVYNGDLVQFKFSLGAGPLSNVTVATLLRNIYKKLIENARNNKPIRNTYADMSIELSPQLKDTSVLEDTYPALGEVVAQAERGNIAILAMYIMTPSKEYRDGEPEKRNRPLRDYTDAKSCVNLKRISAEDEKMNNILRYKVMQLRNDKDIEAYIPVYYKKIIDKFRKGEHLQPPEIMGSIKSINDALKSWRDSKEHYRKMHGSYVNLKKIAEDKLDKFCPSCGMMVDRLYPVIGKEKICYDCYKKMLRDRKKKAGRFESDKELEDVKELFAYFEKQPYPWNERAEAIAKKHDYYGTPLSIVKRMLVNIQKEQQGVDQFPTKEDK